MGLRKGQTNNKAGKPKGAVNKLSKDLRITITDFLRDSWPEVIKEFSKLKGRDKVNFYRDLLQYAIPKMQAITMDADINFNTMSEAELDQIAFRLLTKNIKENGKNDE
jgi:hypothetical protein